MTAPEGTPSPGPEGTINPAGSVNGEPVAVALGNASLFGVGYLMLGRRGLAALTGLVTLVLLIILGTAARTLWFEIVVLLWWLTLVAHGWYLAGGWPPRRRRAGSRSRLVLGVAVFLPVLVAFALLRLHVASINDRVAAAVRSGDCRRATAALAGRWAGDYLADAPGAVRGAGTGRVCGSLGDTAGRLDAVVTNSDLSSLPPALTNLSAVLAAWPDHAPMVLRTLDDFLGRLPLSNPCDTVKVLDTLGAYSPRDAVRDQAGAAVPRLTPPALLGCGDREFGSKDWNGAKASYQRLLDDYPKSPLVPKAFGGLVAANRAIELDHVRAALGAGPDTSYCSNPVTWSGATPYRGASPNRAVLHGQNTYTNQLPGDWLVDDVAKAPLVICVSPKEYGDLVESCDYDSDAVTSVFGTRTVSFHKVAVPIRVVEVLTGHVVADLRVQVTGASCPSVIDYTTFGYFDTGPSPDMYVDVPDSDVSAAVRDALAPIINP
ncbi:tetratricopeptide repeat protein [Pseudofrankia inefficax]|uniref:Uncharacterized protein n=1 Tax=Pseudofrankia inefficax (strain DSM 45817 / CECT 9037 / DDB 130130 / EuI1c) TaxID=298654 RepID=E3IX93_PSEI1|nr:hypothetical protein [Pseudofrankia inefficax]ADP84993.1 hypothetical protein FraEuI1c_7026 [Pseudofrankia inefficax]